jgi:DNA-binding NarL/FixJ family response regulator
MDRSRITASIAEVTFARDVAGCADAEVVIVDLARFGAAVGDLRRALPDARIVAFGPHVDEDAANDATAAGADVVLPRSRFFRDPAAAISAT